MCWLTLLREHGCGKGAVAIMMQDLCNLRNNNNINNGYEDAIDTVLF